jgi:IS5 family transposase
VRVKVERVFRAMKCRFSYRKMRHRGIAKNGAQVPRIASNPIASNASW